MTTELYFDTARLGRMCKEARQAEQDFSKLASQLGSSLYWERFLAEGFEALPTSLRDRPSAATRRLRFAPRNRLGIDGWSVANAHYARGRVFVPEM
jgi:hypothetical protein